MLWVSIIDCNADHEAEDEEDAEDDNEADRVWKAQHSLAEYTAPTNFKSYDELKTRLDAVLSGTVRVGNVADDINEAPVAAPRVDTKPQSSNSVTSPVVDKEEDDMTVHILNFNSDFKETKYEKIYIGERIRDMIDLNNGFVLMSLETNGSLGLLENIY